MCHIIQLLTEAGFSDIQIYDDANYPGKDDLPDDVLYGVEPLPSQALPNNLCGEVHSDPFLRTKNRW